MTEERFSLACSGAIAKITALVNGKKQCLTRAKRVIVSMIEQGRNVDARNEALTMIQTQYIVDIYEGLLPMVTALAKAAVALPKMGLVPRSLDVEIRTVVFFANKFEDVKELVDIKKMLLGQFGSSLQAEATETSGLVDFKLQKKYHAYNNVRESTIDALLEALRPSGMQKVPTQPTNQIPTTEPTLFPQQPPQQQPQQSSYSRFPSMNAQNNDRFPTFDAPKQQETRSPSFDAPQQPQQTNRFPSLESQPQQENKFPSFGNPQQQTESKFPSFDTPAQQDTRFPSFAASQQPQQENKFPSFNSPQQQETRFPSFDKPQQPQQSGNFPSFEPQPDNKFPSFGTPQPTTAGTFAPIPDSAPVGGDFTDDDLLARMDALRD